MTFWVSGQALADWRRLVQAQAISVNIDPTEVDWLLQRCTELDKLALRLETFQAQQIASTHSLKQLQQLWQCRLVERCPIQYLIGKAPWRHFELTVSPTVLIPRPETELLIDLVEQQVRLHPDLARGDWADLGTGSGAIALGLASVLPEATIHGVDASAEALTIAMSNAQQYRFNQQIQFYQGSWWQPLGFLQGKLKGMVSNPPYIPTAELTQLQPEVYRHEPTLALDGGEDGLLALRHLVQTAPDYLQSQGLWAIEMMAGQGEAVQQLLAAEGNYHSIQVFQDLAGIERFVLAFRR